MKIPLGSKRETGEKKGEKREGAIFSGSAWKK